MCVRNTIYHNVTMKYGPPLITPIVECVELPIGKMNTAPRKNHHISTPFKFRRHALSLSPFFFHT